MGGEVRANQIWVPRYISQRLDVSDPDWQHRSCSIANLAMALNCRGASPVPSVNELIKEGLSIGGYKEGIGWEHETLVRLARNHDVLAYRQEFKSNNPEHHGRFAEAGLVKIRDRLADGFPVIVSINNKFDGNRGAHTIFLFRDYGGDFFYHDPDTEIREEGMSQRVSHEKFLGHWRRFAIFFE